MRIIDTLRRLTGDLTSRIADTISPTRCKMHHELRYWSEKKKEEGVLTHNAYEYFYTTHFGLSASYYEDKVILDIGCGPRGSLVWASMASRRIGLDPLAREYLRLGARHHQMEYLDASSEAMPLKDAECDVVSSFNSLDHVKDVYQTLREVKRVTRPGGLFLLLVEVNHPPTVCEPHQLTPKKLVDSLKPEFDCESVQVYRPGDRGGMYGSIRAGNRLSHPEDTNKIGYMSAKFLYTTSGLRKNR
jgi:SAM-dependent methyltransferase